VDGTKTVPALREAIRQEEEAEGTAPVNPNTTADVNGVEVGVEVRNGAGKKRSKKGAVADGKDLDDRDRDKIDGRAGPRSENIVLSKSMNLSFFLSRFSKAYG
jgi:hypothetical protein